VKPGYKLVSMSQLPEPPRTKLEFFELPTISASEDHTPEQKKNDCVVI